MALNQNDVIYFVLTDRFYAKPGSQKSDEIKPSDPFAYHGGNLDGIREKIPYLKKLGITALWITPVYLQVHSPNIGAKPYHGYWALDFNSIDPLLYIDNGKYPKGSKQYLADLADELHRNGIKLILDMVVNHTGYDHPALADPKNNPTPIRAEWFNRFGLDCSQDMIKGALAGLPDLNLDNIDVIDYHIQTILSWIEETHIDMIRMDTAKHVERGFWQYYKTLVRGKHPEVGLLGEALVFDIEELTNFQKFWGFDSLFDFPVQQEMCIRDRHRPE